VYEKQIAFEISGLQYAGKSDQLRNFRQRLRVAFSQLEDQPVPKDWLDAFFQLTEALDATEDNETKRVIFFDEVSWLATHKVKFLMGLSCFWNSWAVRWNMVVVICDSRSVNRDADGVIRITSANRKPIKPGGGSSAGKYCQNNVVYIVRSIAYRVYVATEDGGVRCDIPIAKHHFRVRAGKSAVQADAIFQ
jgi:hypothetical protein